MLTCSLYSLISASSEATSLLMMPFTQDSGKLWRQLAPMFFGLGGDGSKANVCALSRRMSASNDNK